MVLDTVGFGMATLDELFGGLIEGDNVVWLADRDAAYLALEAAFLARAAPSRRTWWVAATASELRRQLPEQVEVIAATPGSALARSAALANELEQRLRAGPPACIVVDEGDMSSHLARMLKQAGQNTPKSLPILEVNPGYALVKRLESDERFDDLAQVLFDQALLAEGGHLEDPAAYVQRVNRMLAA